MSLGERPYIVNREVQALGARGRDDVRRVAREVEPAVLHRLDDVAAHAGDALLEHRALGERPPVETEPGVELLPDALVRPLGEVLVVRNLDVQPAELERAQTEQGETV